MKKTIFLMTIILAASLLTSCGKKVMKDNYGCFVDYEQALDNAEKKKQPLLMFFTSEGDDEQSTQMVADILKAPQFLSEIAKDYTVFHADFSQNAFGKLVDSEDANAYTTIIQNNYQLAMLLGVDIMPEVILCTKEGYIVGRVESDEDFLNYDEFKILLEDNNEKLDKFNSLVAATKKGSAIKKVEAIDSLYVATEEAYRTFLLPLVKLVPELDKNNESGLLGKYIMATAEAQALTAYSQGDTEGAIKQYLEVADNKYVKNEDKQECFYTAAYLAVYSGSDDYEGILTYLETAYDLAPDSDKAPAIDEAITYFHTVLDNIDDYKLETGADEK